MKKFLKVALKSQWKIISVIFVLLILQTIFQMEIIDLFSQALTGVKSQNIDLLLKSGLYMVIFTVFSMICMYAVSRLSVRVSSNATFNIREKIFHILMNLSDEEIGKFKLTALITWSTRSMSIEQGFIVMILEQLILIPFTFIAILYEIALIDGTYALFFLAFVSILAGILFWRLKQFVEIFFKIKKTYGKINRLFLSKITNIANNIPFKKQDTEAEFEKACEDSYDISVKYLFSQYYLGTLLLWGLYVLVLITLAMVNSGYSIGFETDSVIDSLIILVFVAYFISTLTVIPSFIDKWPSAYTNSVLLEDILDLEDEILENTNDNPKRIEIVEEDITREDEGIWAERKDIIQKFKRILKEDKAKVIISMVLLMVSTLCMAYAPKVAGKTLDLLISNLNSSNDIAIYTNIALLIVLYSVGFLFKLPPKRIMGVIGEKVAYNLRMELFDKIDAIGSGFIQENSKGHILSRVNNDLMLIREFVTFRFPEIYAQILMIAFVLVLILMTDFRLGLVYLVILPIYAICLYACHVKSKTNFNGHQKHMGRMMGYFERGLENRDSFHEKGFEKINQTVIVYYAKSRNIANVMVPITTFLTNISNITVYIFGIYLLVGGEIQLGTLLAVIMYAQLLTNPIKKLSSSMASIETIFSSIKRIFAIIDYKKDE